jgi:large subunit ribosomal protein L25
MKNIEFNVEDRKSMTKNELRRFRNEGFVPGVLYGKHIEKNFNLSFQTRELIKLLNNQGRSVILSLKSDNKDLNGKLAIIKKIDKDIIKENIFLNVDLVEITAGEKISLKVYLNFLGEPKGAKEGGVVDIKRRRLYIECFPKDIPNEIEVDISNLDVNDVIHVGDLKLKEGIEVLDDKDLTLVSVSIIKEKVEEPVEAAEGEEETEGEAAKKPEEGKKEEAPKDDKDKKEA